ncbi:thiamine phosphate synthase [Occallatibacter savannae]|uniref:thiamine phosphate synthase n=1 Tax=Occallatibacter savannae TaxID=1002691 RepID=UPI000D693416|nr:thiamine phosphate synthase [Occallatibacter savannae]
MALVFPKVYPILDASVIPKVDREKYLIRLGTSLVGEGVTLLEYRNKVGSESEIISDSAVLRRAMPSQYVKLILDDRADLVGKIGFNGVHVDEGDLSPSQARSLLGPSRIVGTFGGSHDLVPGILGVPADYLAIGPVFETRTKRTEEVPIGVEGVRRLREQAGSGVVLSAAAGITLANARAVLDAGATMVAVSEAIFKAADPAREFARWVRELS